MLKTNNMKIRIIAILLTFVVALPFASGQKPSFGILGGANFQNINGKSVFGDKFENKIIPGFHAGFDIQIPLVPDFYFQPGLLFTTKGCKDFENNDNLKVNISYLELPLNLVYKPLVGKGHFMLGFGPYLGYGISGKIKSGEASNDIEFRNKVDSHIVTTLILRPFDAGANIFAGYELPAGLFFRLNAQLGLIKINPEYTYLPESDYLLKNTGFSLSAGFRF